METFIGLIDSGLGGRNTLPQNTKYHQYKPETYVSYGTMTDGELLKELGHHFKYLLNLNVGDVYVGCYTLSCLIDRLSIYFWPQRVHTMLDILDVDSFDTVIGTPKTCDYFSKTHNVIPCPHLAYQIENNQKIILPEYQQPVGRLLIGCTHYYQIKNLINTKYSPTSLQTPVFSL